MKIVRPRVTTLAATTMATEDGSIFSPKKAEEWLELPDTVHYAEYLTEFAGRACYQSFDRPNPATNTTEKYLNRTLFEQKHWSIAEHASATFYIEGVSRAFTHELIRHRHLSYSQLSQRFVDETDAGMVLPPAVRKSLETVALGTEDYQEASLPEAFAWWGEDDVLRYEAVVEALEGEGLPRKQAREAARAVLPNMAETKIVVTGNLRAWHEFCERRTQPDADAEMQEVAGMIYDQLTALAPTIFPKKEEQ